MDPSLTNAQADHAPRAAEALRIADRARQLEREGSAREALEEFDLALSLLERQRPSPAFADILRWKGTLLRETGDLGGAAGTYARSLDMARRLPYAGGIANVLNCQAIVAQRRGETALARRLFAEAGLNAVHAGERRLFSIIEQNLGALAMVQGDLRDAAARFKVSLRGFRDMGDDEGACWVLGNLARLQSATGEGEAAMRSSEEALAIAQRLEHRPLEGAIELARVEILVGAGRAEEAEHACRRGLAIAERAGDRARRAEGLRLLALIARERGDYERATRSLDEARGLARESEDALLAAEVERDAGDVWHRRGEGGPARMAWEQALARFRALGASVEVRAVEGRLAAAA